MFQGKCNLIGVQSVWAPQTADQWCALSTESRGAVNYVVYHSLMTNFIESSVCFFALEKLNCFIITRPSVLNN